MSKPSSPPPLTLEEELADMMKEVTPPPDNDFDETLGGQPEPPRTSSPAPDTDALHEHPPASGPIRSNEQRAARRLADRLNLHPYQKEALKELVSASQVSQIAIIYIQQCVLENKLDNMIATAPPYKITPALKMNIESVVTAVLLSSKLSQYKGDIPKDRVLSFMLRDRLHIPSTFDTDISVSNEIEVSIGEYLTQARSRIKKAVRESVKSKTKNFDLATKLVKDTKCSVTVPLCGKIAILRSVYVKSPGTDFWDKVDTCLELMRTVSEGNPIRIARAIKAYLKKDMEIYGTGVHDRLAPKELNSWQQGVDDSLTEAADKA